MFCCYFWSTNNLIKSLFSPKKNDVCVCWEMRKKSSVSIDIELIVFEKEKILCLCGFALFAWLFFFFTLIRSGPTNNRLALDKKKKKLKIIYDSLFLNWYRIFFSHCYVLSGTVLLRSYISISINFHFSKFCSIWLINL